MERDLGGYLADLYLSSPRRLPPSPAQLDVLRCLSHGMTDRMAADALGVSTETVKTHVTFARQRLAAKNRTHAVALAIRLGLIL